MRNRAFRTIATTLSLLLLAGAPVKAGPITIREVIQVLGYQNAGQAPQLVLQDISQDPNGKEGRPLTKTSGVDSPSASSQPSVDNTNSLFGGVVVAPSVDVVDSDVDGSICDCGEIPTAGGFPKWPLLFLAGIPLVFIHHGDCEVCTSPTPNPTPQPTPLAPVPGIPEPTSLVLLGSGLVAFATGLRRRRSMASLKKDVDKGEEDRGL